MPWPVPGTCLSCQPARPSPPHILAIFSWSGSLPFLAELPAPLLLSRHKQWFHSRNGYSLYSVPKKLDALQITVNTASLCSVTRHVSTIPFPTMSHNASSWVKYKMALWDPKQSVEASSELLKSLHSASLLLAISCKSQAFCPHLWVIAGDNHSVPFHQNTKGQQGDLKHLITPLRSHNTLWN